MNVSVLFGVACIHAHTCTRAPGGTSLFGFTSQLGRTNMYSDTYLPTHPHTHTHTRTHARPAQARTRKYTPHARARARRLRLRARSCSSAHPDARARSHTRTRARTRARTRTRTRTRTHSIPYQLSQAPSSKCWTAESGLGQRPAFAILGKNKTTKQQLLLRGPGVRRYVRKHPSGCQRIALTLFVGPSIKACGRPPCLL